VPHAERVIMIKQEDRSGRYPVKFQWRRKGRFWAELSLSTDRFRVATGCASLTCSNRSNRKVE
jgi:hypothetical protein